MTRDPRPPSPTRDLVEQIVRTTGLPPGDARRVVDDVVAYFSLTADDYVRHRHRDLQSHGLTNDTIFELIGGELAQWPVRAPRYSARQLRRIVYG